MKFTSVFASSLLLGSAAAQTSTGSVSIASDGIEPTWSTLTPNGSIPTAATTDFSGTLGLSIKMLGNASSFTSTGTAAVTSTAKPTQTSLPKSCKGAGFLNMTLSDSLLRDSHGRAGAIVANKQFQFDGPPPQSGTIYAAGWSIYNGALALGNQTTFYECKSGDFFNLYSELIGDQCYAVEFSLLEFVDC